MANFDDWSGYCVTCANDHTIPHTHKYCNAKVGITWCHNKIDSGDTTCYLHGEIPAVNYDPTDRGDTRPMPRPKDDEICSSCKHTFKLHYLAYNGMTTGCSFDIPSGGDQRDSWGGHKCECKGFQFTYKYR